MLKRKLEVQAQINFKNQKVFDFNIEKSIDSHNIYGDIRHKIKNNQDVLEKYIQYYYAVINNAQKINSNFACMFIFLLAKDLFLLPILNIILKDNRLQIFESFGFFSYLCEYMMYYQAFRNIGTILVQKPIFESFIRSLSGIERHCLFQYAIESGFTIFYQTLFSKNLINIKYRLENGNTLLFIRSSCDFNAFKWLLAKYDINFINARSRDQEQSALQYTLNTYNNTQQYISQTQHQRIQNKSKMIRIIEEYLKVKGLSLDFFDPLLYSHLIHRKRLLNVKLINNIYPDQVKAYREYWFLKLARMIALKAK